MVYVLLYIVSFDIYMLYFSGDLQSKSGNITDIWNFIDFIHISKLLNVIDFSSITERIYNAFLLVKLCFQDRAQTRLFQQT
jgi:hypothetical protein